MNFTQQFVALTVATLKADGKANVAEYAAIKFLAEGLKLDANEVDSLIAEEAKKDQDVVALAKSIADSDDKEVLMEACSIVALADNSLDVKEVELLLQISNALGVSPAKTVLSIAATAQNNRMIKIAGNETNFEEDEVLIEEEA